MGMTVDAALRLKCFAGARAVAGLQHLDRHIQGVTIMEAPDIVQWLKGGELVLTSLYPIRSDQAAQENLVRELVSRGAAGLAIKTRRFVGVIPEPMLEVANSLGLPIIELPMEVSYVDVITSILSEIVNQQAARLKYSDEVHSHFTSVALSGGTLEELAFALAGLVDNQVVIKDRNGQVMVQTCQGYREKDRTDAEGEQQPLNNELNYYRQPLRLLGADGEVNCTEVVVPILIQEETYGYLCVWETGKVMHERDFIALEHAATVVALQLAKRRAVEEIERKYQNDFLMDLLEGNIESEETVYNRASFLGWHLVGPFMVIVANIDSFEEYVLRNKNKGEGFAQKVKVKFLDAMTQSFRTHNPKIIVGSKSDTVIALYPVKSTEADKVLIEVKALGEALRWGVRRYLKELTFSIGIGGLAKDIAGLALSYNEAREALRFGRMVNGPGSMTAYSELGLFRLLCQIPDRKVLATFIPFPIKQLLQYDQNNHTDLTKSLETYLEANGNLKVAAERLFVHYKTMRYRIERIQEITGLDLDCNNSRLELQVGFKVLKLLASDLESATRTSN